MTPLFPKQGPITIKQGHAGDCYLLTAIDCVLHTGEEGLSKVKSLFTETPEGVHLKIKRTEIYYYSNNFSPEKLKDKYTYHYDLDNNEDVFFLSNKRLKEIDDSVLGVTTNSLAIKILERVSAYYYTGEWPNDDLQASVIAHNIPERHLYTTSTEFVGKFLGVHAQDTTSLNDIIKLKAINPTQPVYISMSYGRSNFGVQHGRHALRIDRIVPKPSGEYDFILINPWDNQKEECFSLSAIKNNKARFCIYSIEEKDYDLAAVLLKCPEDTGKYIYKERPLFNLLSQLQQVKRSITEQDIACCRSLYSSTPYLTDIFSALSAAERTLFLDCLRASKGDKKEFIHSLVRAIPNYQMIHVIYERDLDLDFELIGKILIDTALDDKHAALKAQLCSNEFFSLVMKAATGDKYRKESLTRIQAAQRLHCGLVNYYYGSDEPALINYLSRSGSRYFFHHGIFSREHITKYWDNKTLLAHAVASVSLLDNNVKGIKLAVGAIDLRLVDNQFFDIMWAALGILKPRDAFFNLHRLSKVNPELAKKLHAMVVSRFKTLYNTDFSLFENEILLENHSDFRKWFKDIITPLSTHDAHQIIASYVQKINCLSFSFAHCLTPVAINECCDSLIKNVEAITHEKGDLIEAARVLALPGVSPLILTASKAKIQMIKDAATVQQQKVRDSLNIIDRYVAQVNNFEISFPVMNSKEIQLQSLALIEKLHAITRNSNEFEVAVKTLCLDGDMPQPVKKAIEDKIKSIETTASTFSRKCLEARSLIAAHTKRIREYQFSFPETVALSDIADEEQQVLDELNKLQANEDVSRAAQFLGCEDELEFVREALILKKQLLNKYVHDFKTRIAETIIRGYCDDIKGFSVNVFETLSTQPAVEARKTTLLDDFSNMLNSNKHLALARQVLAGSDFNSIIEHAIAEKRQEISVAAELRCEQLKTLSVIMNYKNQIHAMQVSFVHISSEQQIAARISELKQQLKALGEEHELIEAVRINNHHPLILAALESKRQEIDATGALRSRILKGAYEVITRHERLIMEMDISFDNASTTTLVDNITQKCQTVLEQIVSSEELVSAQFLLRCIGNMHPVIEKAVKDKKQEITKNAGIRCDYLAATEVITAYAHKIDSLTVYFSDIPQIQEIDGHCAELIGQLNAITNKNELLKAQESLGYKNESHPTIKKAFECKKHNIEMAAQERSDEINAALQIISGCVSRVRNATETFSRAKLHNVEELNDHKVILLKNLTMIFQDNKDLVKAQQTLGFSTLHPEINAAQMEKREAIIRNAAHAKQQLASRLKAEALLEKINFEKQIEIIGVMREQLKEKAKTIGEYEPAATEADKLYSALNTAKEEFLESDKPEKQRIKDFRDASLKAIGVSLEVLAVHRGWKEFLANMANVIITVCTVGLANLIAGRLKLFQPQTKSAQITAECAEVFKGIEVGA